MVGFTAVTKLSSNRSISFEIASLRLSESEATCKESCRIETQDPLELLQETSANGLSSTPTRKNDRKTEPENIIKLTKFIILTPEQKRALDGPRRQFIVGAAGSGKTIIIQSKALELLRDGKSVFVFTPPWYAIKYKQLFDEHNFTEFDIRSSWDELRRDFYPYCEIDNVQEDIASYAYDFVKNQLNTPADAERLKNTTLFRLFSRYDGFFIDDMLDRFLWNRSSYELDSDSLGTIVNDTADVLLSLMLMAFAKLQYPSKIVWIAFDGWIDHEHFYFLKNFFKRQQLLEKFLNSENAVSKLHRVMRCPENVFRAAYDFSELAGPTVRPKLGHKIQGRRETINIYCTDRDDGMRQIWEEFKMKLDHLSANRISLDNVCLVVGGGWNTMSIQTYLFHKCEEYNIPTRVLLSNYPLNFESTKSSGNPSIYSGNLLICGSVVVSSEEWPIVIFIDYYDASYTRSVSFRDYYRARSRATAELVEIIASRVSGVRKIHRSLSEPCAKPRKSHTFRNLHN